MFAVFWNAFMLFFSGVTIWGMLHAPQVGLWETVGLIAFEGIFWAVGIGLAIWAWDMATRSAMIGVAGEQMFIETKSSFGTKWVEFNQSKIHSISVQNSGTSVNDVPIKHLLVETEGQPPVGLFANGGRCVLVVVWRGIRCNGNLRLALQLAQVNSGRFPRTTNDHSTVAARNEATDVRARRHQEYLHRNERVKNWQPDTLPIGSSHP